MLASNGKWSVFDLLEKLQRKTSVAAVVVFKMPPAARRNYDFQGGQMGPEPVNPDTPRGPYITHIECQTRADVNDDYKTHIEVAHRLPLKAQELAIKQAEQNLSKQLADRQQQDTDSIASTGSARFVQKRDSIPRPKIGVNPKMRKSDPPSGPYPHLYLTHFAELSISLPHPMVTKY